MPKIRVDAEPLILSSEDIKRIGAGWFVESAGLITMPLIKGMEVSQDEKMTSKLTQPVKLRRNLEDKTQFHFNLTRFNCFRIMVPVILAEIDEPTRNGIASTIGCISI